MPCTGGYNYHMQTLFDLKKRCSVQLLSEQTVWGITSYTVYNPFLDSVYSLQQDEVRFTEPEPRNSIEIEADIRYRLLLPRLQNELRGGAVAPIPIIT